MRQVYGIELRRLVACLTLLAGSSCAYGPKLNYCITGEKDVMGCARTEPIPYADADLWRCVSPNDQNKILRDCKLGAGLPAVNYCIIYTEPYEGPTAFCGDGSVMIPSEMQNWVCLSERESERLLLWCKRKRDDG